jgi:glycyl-tRNA synthetase beta chain
MNFFKDRIVYFLKSKNIRYDVIDSIIHTSLRNLSTVKLKLDAISNFLRSDYKSSYLEMIKRIENIIKNKNIPEQIKFETLETDCEKNLYTSIPKVKKNVLKEISNHNYSSIFPEILSVKEHVNFMFDNLLIVSENKINTLNRLYLLNAVLQLSNYFFNSTKLIDENK